MHVLTHLGVGDGVGVEVGDGVGLDVGLNAQYSLRFARALPNHRIKLRTSVWATALVRWTVVLSGSA
jgi:hypothetical protein